MCNSFAMGYIVNYNSELFPVSVRGFSLGLSLFIGRLLMSIFPFMNSLLDSYNLHRLSPIILSSFVTLLLSFTLPETNANGLI